MPRNLGVIRLMGVGGYQRGLSLAEVVISTALLGVVLASSMHVVSVAGRSAEGVHDRIAPHLQASRIAGQMGDELATAVAITSAETDSISFAIPDRDNDGNEETVSYSLTANQLIRTYNGAAATLMDGVGDFCLQYRARFEERHIHEEETVRSGEVTLAYHDGYDGYPYSYYSFGLGRFDQVAQYFEIRGLPAEAVSFDITKIMLRACKYDYSSSGLLTVTMERPLSPSQRWPDGNVLDQASIDVSEMSSEYYGWYPLYFSNLTGLSPKDNAFAMRLMGGSTTNCLVSATFVEAPPGPDDGMEIFWSEDGGATWPHPTHDDGDVRFYLFGEYAVISTVDEIAEVWLVTGVGVEITPQEGGVPARRFARLRNQPLCDLDLPDPGDDDLPVIDPPKIDPPAI